MTWRLIPLGRLSWTQVLAHARGLTCAWADLGGFQVGPPPQAPPPYSHLWGWCADRCLRVRIDGQMAIAAVLTSMGTEGREVPVSDNPLKAPRREGYDMPAGTRPWWESGGYRTLTVMEPVPLTFVQGDAAH